jgi:hypothetical protein
LQGVNSRSLETCEPAKRLYSAKQIALATFLGGPLAASWLFARNYRLLGEPRMSRHCVIWGAVGTIAILTVLHFVPRSFPSMTIAIGCIIGLYQTARQVHGRAVSEHLAAGGRLGSWWRVVGIGAAGFAAVFAFLCAVYYLITV